jgi:hypothetical protein
MAAKLTLEFDEVAVAKLHSLMERFGEHEPETMINRALGLLDTIDPFMTDGAFTVFDQKAEKESDEFVRVVFENAAKRAA